MTDVARLDPVRRRMLEDMGIDVWLLRDSPVPTAVAAALASSGPSARNQPERPSPAKVLVAGSKPLAEAPSDVVREPGVSREKPAPPAPRPPIASQPSGDPLAVTCLVSGRAILLVDNAEQGMSRRLCADLLAAVTADWSAAPREIAFGWPGDRNHPDCWRAFTAFAQRQLAESEVRVVLCSEALFEHLQALSGERSETGHDFELVSWSALDAPGAEHKQALWRRIQSLST